MTEPALNPESDAASRGAPGWLDRALADGIRLNAETVILGLLLIAAVISRFYDLGVRVVSHDEVTHVYWSYNLFRGLGFQHNPLSHGPLQFHLISLSYFLFGVSDFTARIPTALAGVIGVGMVFLFRRWLGRTGALAAAALMLVSPYILYYNRYARNESFVVVEGLAMFWAVFRYTETRQARWLYLLAASLTLHFATKETSFIYAAQLLVFLAGAFVWHVLRASWSRRGHRVVFAIGLLAAVVGFGVSFLAYFRNLVTATKAFQAGETFSGPAITPLLGLGLILMLAGTVLFVAALLSEFGRRLRSEFPALDLLIITGTITLTQLPGLFLPPEILARYGDGGNPEALLDPLAVQRLTLAIPLFLLLAIAVGVAWDWRRWGIAVAVAVALYVPFYTTMFSHSLGLLTGSVGSLAYWLGNQGVERGSQPWYYYGLLQIPLYEFLPALGSLAALVIGARRLLRRDGTASGAAAVEPADRGARFPVIGFLGYWAFTSLVAYTYAGEKMPWLTVHITLGMILLTGWVIGRLLESIDWAAFRSGRAWVITGLLVLGLVAAARAVGLLAGLNPPFGGVGLDGLNATLGFLTSLVTLAAVVFGLALLIRGWRSADLLRLGALIAVAALFGLTARAAFRAAYVNFDNATEFLVYAHSATGSKTLLEQVEDLSRRTTDGMSIDVAYDDRTSYPFMWYLRDFPNTHPFGSTPGRDLLNYPLIIAGDANYPKVDPLVGDRYFQFEYTRMWWPMQDYWGLTWERVWNAIRSPDYRDALWDVWLNRDFTAYGQLTQVDYSLQHWSPAERMRLYVRKDIAAMIWDYGALPASLEPVEFADPYEDQMTDLAADSIFGPGGTVDLQLSRPRSIAVARDGTLYIADTGNHRILHVNEQGEVLHSWGTFAESLQGAAPGGTFNEPWGVAVAPDGSVYVADTWNHRIQHFTSRGDFLGMFGTYGTGETATAFWGPRSVAVDSQGRVYVSDTGNKRIVVFDRQGESVGSFGSAGYGPGQLNEPVGVAVGPDDTVYVDDTWNGRIQGFRESEPGVFEPVIEWTIDGWYGQSLDNKPYLAVSPDGEVCTSEPEGYRLLCFDPQGVFLTGWGDAGSAVTQFNLPTGVAFDREGHLWVADAGNDRVMRFTPDWP
ncbi:MAG: hypothetical protein A2Y93_01610 [Chloroflexi bacterium RBG_13_68_17]|nr:MAG: hypothetical protein A2Y93_01610 [Chloroflexi bacterium RBG_13_68_17]